MSLCAIGKTGLEGFEDGEALVRRDGDGDGEDPELPDLDEGKSLQFLSYKAESETDVLRLKWRTKYACEGVKAPSGSGGSSSSGGWGFFTWLLIIVFLLAAAYIVFGSWLNYTRYGARGWDLVPHGDTIRDLPYVAREWVSGVKDRFGNGDMRGGYSAV